MSKSQSVIKLIDARAVPAALKGRGTAWALPHRFHAERHEDFDDGWGTLQQQVSEARLPPHTLVLEEAVRSILAANDSPDIGFDLSINPYRGCEHGCIYCYARPTHSYLNLSPGIDFETRIVAKMNAAQRLREAFCRRGYVLLCPSKSEADRRPGDPVFLRTFVGTAPFAARDAAQAR